jgi:hypothetical protein
MLLVLLVIVEEGCPGAGASKMGVGMFGFFFVIFCLYMIVNRIHSPVPIPVS